MEGESVYDIVHKHCVHKVIERCVCEAPHSYLQTTLTVFDESYSITFINKEKSVLVEVYPTVSICGIANLTYSVRPIYKFMIPLPSETC